MRLTINKAHDAYINAIASQMGTTPQQALNWMLWKLRESNYNFGGILPQYPMPNVQQPQQQFEPATAMSGLSFIPQSPQAIQEFEQVAEEIDPVISRLLALGLESF
ncbi:hypothetical protein H6G33_36500 [Calothrix sp. FACHB-1219]|uniref:hypothetical protein n=1 Tax=unclassified Calothrix TaxID=2619626 RepID=UPI00168404B7|nr:MULTISPECIES: hypothetical protein [unclassified Calothrix]MBD2207830.1 hypothetical protein [Calothrix sp. FACHB-168]MBD2222434.1 hypothetical protein [Calothrix sp. FACHB-1219]